MDINSSEVREPFSQVLKTQASILGGFVALIWVLELVDSLLLNGGLDTFGIVPRQIAGLQGVLFAPFLHAGFEHVFANTLPFIILGWFVMLRSMRTFFVVSIIAILVSGLGTWVTGPSGSIHLGASGLIFGYFGYLLSRGYFERSWQAILWSIFVALIYGWMLLGILPRGLQVSWQSHLFGFLGGVLAAYWLAKERQSAAIDLVN